MPAAARGWLFWAALIAASALLFAPGLMALGRAWATPEYSHGPIIPVLALFLFLRVLRDRPADPAPPRRWQGLALMGAALVLGLAGHLARIPDVVAYALILWIAGVALAQIGWARGRQCWPALAYLLFMLPLPQMLYWRLTLVLQLISSELGVGIIRLAGIPVYLEGNIIDLGNYQLQVAEACSGLRYLFPILSFSYLFAVLYRGPVWHRVVLLAAAAPITVAMNAARIGGIGILVRHAGIAQAEGALHWFEGWVLFVACVALLMALAALMQRLAVHPRPLAQVLDLETTGLLPILAQAGRITAPAPLWAAIALTGVAATIGLVDTRSAAPQVPRATFASFPQTLGPWQGQVEQIDTATLAVLDATDHLSITYATADGHAPVNLFAAWYADQATGSGIHSPTICLPAAGWEIASLNAVPVQVNGQSLTVNRALIRQGLERQLVYYWFDQRGRVMTNDYAVKASVIADGLLRGRKDGALIRLVTPIGADEEETAADARLTQFLGLIVTDLPRYIPR